MNKATREVLLSSLKMDWETPNTLYHQLDHIFYFTLDAAANSVNKKHSSYFTIENRVNGKDAFTNDWKGSVFCNPPYGRNIKRWILRGFQEYRRHQSTVVFLIPARPDTKAWQDIIFPHAKYICFLRGRIKFEIDGTALNPAPFPSAIIVLTDNTYDLSSLDGYTLITK